MKIDYMSDLHLEFLDYPDFSKVEGGDVLILAGDITTAAMFREGRTDKDARSHAKYMKKFKTDLIDKYKRVFYVMGNHEHYNSIYKKTLGELSAGFTRCGIHLHFLDNSYSRVDDVIFIGSTLWSDFEKGDDLSMYRCGQYMNDFHLIGALDVEDLNYFNRNSTRKITPEMIYEEFKKNKKFIEDAADNFNDKKVVVITHHGPTYQSLNTQHIGNGADGAYASDIPEVILDRPQIKYWVSGHCHSVKEYDVGHCRVVQNCRGYKHEHSYLFDFTGPKSFEL